MNNSHQITVTDVRLSYVKVFEGEINKSGRRVWGLTVLIKKDSPQIPAINEAIKAAKIRDAEKVGKTGIKLPLLDGDALDDDGEFKYEKPEHRGCFMLRCGNYKRRPSVVDQSVQPIIDPEKIYSGCYGNVRISFYGYNSGTNRGISPGLESVQLVREGERLGNGPADPSELFTSVEDDFLS
jgi:hypothetical protein